MKTPISTIIIIVLFALSASGQDTHYATNKFGSKSTLLGGAVVGGNLENDMVFYNPAALGFMQNSGLTLNTNAYRIENIKIDNDFANQKSFKNSHLSTIPVLVGGLINLKDSSWKLGYGIFSPVDFDFRATSRRDDRFNAIDDNISLGEELFIGELTKIKTLRELSVSVGAAKRLSDKWAVGLSALFTYRGQSYAETNLSHIQFNDSENTQMSTTMLMESNYFHIDAKLKLGVNYRQGPWSAGITLTTPGLKLMGNGEVAGDVVADNLPINSELNSFFASDRQEDLKSTYKAPVVIGFGVNYTFQSSVLYFSGNYHFSQDLYEILQPDANDFFRSNNVSTIFGSDEILRVLGGAKSVVNVSIGYEYFLRPDVTFYASISTDNSFLPEEESSQFLRMETEISSWDIYHLALGVSKEYKKSKFTVGLLTGVGRSEDHLTRDVFDGPSTEGTLFTSGRISEARYTSFGLILGYQFSFGK